jgi:sugar/nucleoside kinase (ribokinase family)
MATSFGKTPQTSQTAAALCVVGNLTIDVILRGFTTMPEWGQEVLCRDRTESVAGQAGAMAFAASALGVRTNVVGVVGDDDAGARIRKELSASGVGVDAIALAREGTTPLTVALVRPDGERAFLSDLGSLPGFDVGVMATGWLAEHPSIVVALVGTSNIRGIDQDAVVELFRFARQEGALTVFDPGWDPLGWPKETVSLVRAVLTETDLFLPNLDEAEALTGNRDVAQMFDVFRELCPGTTVVKGGASGSYVVNGERIVNVRAIETSVDNAVGAGDVFDSALIAGYLNGRDVLACVTLASAAASIYVGRREHRFPRYAESADLANTVEVVALNS